MVARAAELDATNFVYDLPDPEIYFPGFIFFDSFSGSMDVAGHRAEAARLLKEKPR